MSVPSSPVNPRSVLLCSFVLDCLFLKEAPHIHLIILISVLSIFVSSSALMVHVSQTASNACCVHQDDHVYCTGYSVSTMAMSLYWLPWLQCVDHGDVIVLVVMVSVCRPWRCLYVAVSWSLAVTYRPRGFYSSSSLTTTSARNRTYSVTPTSSSGSTESTCRRACQSFNKIYQFVKLSIKFYEKHLKLCVTSTVFDLISGLSAYVILGPKNRPN